MITIVKMVMEIQVEHPEDWTQEEIEYAASQWENVDNPCDVTVLSEEYEVEDE